ncbi:caspase family protein [Streptomyces umbrinus]|uniref:caspase family protein n=1 Tax=Streptomyces umbrinus TaxID=67370 RepID=UPI0033DDD235
MERAVVLIGVRQSGNLTELQAVGSGIEAMHSWAVGQGIPADLIKTFSDHDGQPVRMHDIFQAVRAYADRGTVGQLVVYFSGHGISNSNSEYWLLSEAPENGNEAVNVELSRRIAENFVGIPHIVLVGDACRTPPGFLHGQVTGQALFPVGAPRPSSTAVDLFYACRPGEAASEIEDPNASAGSSYRAVYTEVLARALQGHYPTVVERTPDAASPISLVRPVRLKTILPGLVTDRINELGALDQVTQWPSSIVSSPADAWLSRFETPPDSQPTPVLPPPSPPGPIGGEGTGNGDDHLPRPGSRWRLRPSAARSTAGWDPAVVATVSAAARLERHSPASKTVRDADTTLRVVGSQLKAAYAGPDKPQLTKSGVRMPRELMNPTAAIVVLADGSSAAIPMFPGLLGQLTLEQERIADLWYVSRWTPEDPQYTEFRAYVAAASRFGIPWWEGNSSEALLRQFADHGAHDPSLAVYLAYALADMGQRDAVHTLIQIHPQVTRALPDPWLILGEAPPPGVPPMPLLARGWAQLDPPGPQQELPVPQPSHWTLFAQTDLPLLRRLING